MEAKLRTAELSPARLELEAEWERLKQLQPCPSIKELEEHRLRFEKVMARHEESAEQLSQLATDENLSVNRSNGEVPMPERPSREQRIEDPRQEHDRHRHGLDGPSLGHGSESVTVISRGVLPTDTRPQRSPLFTRRAG